MDCDFEGCKLPVEYVSSRRTSSSCDFPSDVQDLVNNRTITGNGILAEYWCKVHSPTNSEWIGEELSDV